MITFQPITFYDFVSLISSLVVSVIFIITLFLNIRQIREMVRQTKSFNDSIKSGTYGNVMQQLMSIDSIFLEHPEIRPYFYNSKVLELSDVNYHIVSAAAEYVLDYYQSYMYQSDHFPEVWPQGKFKLYVINAFSNSPVLCSYLESLREFYPGELVKWMEEGRSMGIERQTLQAFSNPITSINTDDPQIGDLPNDK